MQVLVRPVISEKAGRLLTLGKYVFEVNASASANQVKKAVENVYDVKVADVNMITVPGKVRRYGRVYGKTKERKKAVVTLVPGQTIEGITEPSEE